MIKSVKILNFQSHEKSKLDFSNGVNVIVGCSDSGKTAIIRALRWLSWNRPSGNSICSNWGGTTNVVIETEEGFVRRSKDKKDTYELLIKGRKNLVFHAFGTNVPEEITTFLNLSEINLQQQLDSPFLLNNSSGEVAQHFNKIARLDKIDSGLQNVQRWIRELEQNIKFRTEQLSKQREEIKTFDYLDKFEAEVEVLEEMEIHRNALVNKRNKLDTLLEHIREVQIDLKNNDWILTFEKPVKNLLKLHEDRKAVETQRSRLFKEVSNIRRITGLLEAEKTKLSALQTKFEKEFPKVCPLCGKPK